MPSTELQMSSEETNAPPVKKRSRARKIALLVSFLMMLVPIVGGSVYLWIHFDVTQTLRNAISSARSKEEPAPAPVAHDTEETTQKGNPPSSPVAGVTVVPLNSFEVNIADASGKRYLLLGVEVEVNDKAGVEEIKQGEPRIRDAVIMLLSGKNYESLATAEGKLQLKNEIAARMNQALGTTRVVRVFFTEFVIR